MKCYLFFYKLILFVVLQILFAASPFKSIATLLAQPQPSSPELEKKIHESENELTVLCERLQQKISPKEKGELQNRFVQLVTDYRIQSLELSEQLMPVPEQDMPKEQKLEWFIHKIEFLESKMKFLENILGRIHHSEIHQQVSSIKNKMFDEIQGFKDGKRYLEKMPDRQEIEPKGGLDKKAFWEILKNPAIIAALISALAAIVVALLKRK